MNSRFYYGYCKLSKDGQQFLEKGYVIKKVENLILLIISKKKIQDTISKKTKKINLNNFHKDKKYQRFK